MTTVTINYPVKDQAELNRSYMPFVIDGGLFVPTTDEYTLGDAVLLELILPKAKAPQMIEGKIVWITPKNSLNNIYPGIGIQFVGENAKNAHNLIKSSVGTGADVGAYTYGMQGDSDNK